MIHLLKQSTKPIGTKYKRRLVSIGSTPLDFHAAQNPPKVVARNAPAAAQ